MLVNDYAIIICVQQFSASRRLNGKAPKTNPDAIRRELKRCNELVVLLTPQSVNRQWVVLEVGAVWGRSKKARISPILYHVTVAPIPDIIKSIKAIQLNDIEDYLDELNKRIRMQT